MAYQDKTLQCADCGASFTFTADDGIDVSNTATVTVTILAPFILSTIEGIDELARAKNLFDQVIYS